MTKCNVADFANNPKIDWSYCPSLPAAILFSILFGLTTCAHLAQTIYYRQKNAAIITFGGLLETVAFILRILVIQTLDLDPVYEAQFVLILIAPLWMNAYDFVMLGRLVNYCMPDRKLLRVPARRIAVIFVCSDVVTFFIQLAGAAITTSHDTKTANMGLHIYTAGVVLQQFFIFIFIMFAIAFQRRLTRECDAEKATNAKKLLWALYGSLSLISFRIIFRIIEFSGNSGSKINSEIDGHEIYQYLFDSLPMIFALVIFNAFHPARFLTGSDAEWPRKKSRKERRAEKKAARAQDMLLVEVKADASKNS